MEHGRQRSWADTWQQLIEHGHRRADIADYTLAEIALYLGAIRREDARQARQHLLLTAKAARSVIGDGKDLMQTVDLLESIANDQPLE